MMMIMMIMMIYLWPCAGVHKNNNNNAISKGLLD